MSVPPGRVMLSVESRLAAEGAGTRLQTRVILSPVSLWGSGERDEPYCVSTGRLEDEIAEAGRARLADEAAPS